MKIWRTATEIHSDTGMREAYEWARLCGNRTAQKHWSLAENTCYATTKPLTWSVSTGRFGSGTESHGSFPGHCHPGSFFSPFLTCWICGRRRSAQRWVWFTASPSYFFFFSECKMAAGVDLCRHHPAEQHRNTESTCQLGDTGLKTRLEIRNQ